MQHTEKTSSHYRMLALNLAISTAVMYLAMFAMIDGWGEFHHNLNTFYMALLMAAPMGVLMLVLMPSMYGNRRANAFIHLGLVAVFVLAFLGIRYQAPIGDTQFLRSMIPHHSGAILMCREAALSDPEIIKLCAQIEQSQRREIDQMERMLSVSK
jgi:uncharacterized protein (DUF305 family)